jgi:hypothetical protein
MKTLIRRARSLSPVVLTLSLLVSCAAMGGNGKIAGKVTAKQTGEPLLGANVVVTHKVLSGGTAVPLDRPLGAAADPE